MTPIANYITNNHLLPLGDILLESNEFCGTDTRELFEQHLITQPQDWYYRHNPVTYTVNSHKYRAPVFGTVHWANSVVIFGCSNVFGVGLDDHDTISSQLSRLIDRPVINLGVGASSIQFATYNSIQLAHGYPCPYAVIQLWPSYSRCLMFSQERVTHLGPWNITQDSFIDRWNRCENSVNHALIFEKISRQTWQHTQYYHASLCKDTAEIFKDCVHFPLVDKARDLCHPGRQTAAQVAHHFAQIIK